MSSFAIRNLPWREQVSAYLPVQLKLLLQGASARDLVNKANASILLYDNKLTHLESRKVVDLACIDADSIAAAGEQLLGNLSAEQQKELAVILLLPSKYFVATTTQMPGIAKDNLAAALRIQSDTILPSFEKPISLAINPDSADQSDEHLALWIAETTLSDLFNAFEAKGIFLAAIKPRLLNVASANGAERPIEIMDIDSSSETFAVVEGGIVKQWLHIHKQDLEQEIFRKQWQESIECDVDYEKVELRDVVDYFPLKDSQSNQDYCFFPKAALNAARKSEKGKRYLVAAAAAVAMLFISTIPFIIQSLEFRSLSATLEEQRQIAIDARQDQAAVVSFENEWGLINDFPTQNIREAMFTLQNILRPDSLSSFELSDGLIKIQGVSSEPQAILQRLEQDPMFTEVIFSRATNNSRYYIDLRLSTVNFEAYMVRYFPDE